MRGVGGKGGMPLSCGNLRSRFTRGRDHEYLCVLLLDVNILNHRPAFAVFKALTTTRPCREEGGTPMPLKRPTRRLLTLSKV